jgi:hypothetical protein
VRALIGAALAAACAALVVPAGAVAPESSDQLHVDAPAFTWSRDSLSVRVEQSGGLAGRRLAILVFVDNNMHRADTTGDVTEVTLTGLELEPGRHRLMVKSGTHEAHARFRYVPPAVTAVAAAVLAGIVLLSFRLFRRRT